MPAPGRYNVPIYFSVPPDIVAEFDKLAGTGYGARSTMFRKQHTFFVTRHNDPTEKALEYERSRRLVAEAKLRDLEAVMKKVFK